MKRRSSPDHNQMSPPCELVTFLIFEGYLLAAGNQIEPEL